MKQRNQDYETTILRHAFQNEVVLPYTSLQPFMTPIYWNYDTETFDNKLPYSLAFFTTEPRPPGG